LAVLGFPCDQFGHQEPGAEDEIKSFCELNYGVTFPLFAKIDVNGDATHPLYRQLKAARKGLLGSEAIKWNFTKFCRQDGEVIGAIINTKPEDLEKDVEGAGLRRTLLLIAALAYGWPSRQLLRSTSNRPSPAASLPEPHLSAWSWRHPVRPRRTCTRPVR
jgi:hypothetical protein